MASTIRFQITNNNSAVDNSGMVPVALTAPSLYIERIMHFVRKILNGSIWASIQVTNTLVAATGTITFSSLANNDTVTVNGRVYTAKTSPNASGAQEFNLGTGGTSDATAATNFAAKLNADTSTLVAGVVSASAAAAITTITAIPFGNIGNLCTTAISAHGSVAGATLTGGSEGTSATIHKGL